jgi:hypothetical protein
MFHKNSFLFLFATAAFVKALPQDAAAATTTVSRLVLPSSTKLSCE